MLSNDFGIKQIMKNAFTALVALSILSQADRPAQAEGKQLKFTPKETSMGKILSTS